MAGGFCRHISVSCLFVFAFGCVGCAQYIPFTQTLQENRQLQAYQIRQIQFYVSEKIVIERKITRKRNLVGWGHVLVMKDGTLWERLVIPKGTPCVLLAVDKESAKVSFDQEDSFFLFAPGELDDRYYIKATGGKNLVSYGQKIYRIKKGHRAHLIFAASQIEKFSYKTHIFGGRTIR